jgi:hypothetical protein
MLKKIRTDQAASCFLTLDDMAFNLNSLPSLAGEGQDGGKLKASPEIPGKQENPR